MIVGPGFIPPVHYISGGGSSDGLDTTIMLTLTIAVSCVFVWFILTLFEWFDEKDSTLVEILRDQVKFIWKLFHRIW